MFRDTDLVPTDLMAGFVLLRVKQKRESREQRRIELVNELRMKYASGKFLNACYVQYVDPASSYKIHT